MEEINKTTNKNLASGKKKNGLALASISLGLVSLILVILELGPLHSLPLITDFLIFVVPASAVICGIIALIIKQNKSFSLMGIILGIILLCVFSLGFSDNSGEARSPALKAGLAGLRVGIATCCRNSDNQLQVGAGSDICSPAAGIILPEHNELLLSDEADLNYAVSAQCDAETPTMTATIQNYFKQACNGVWTITENKMIPPPALKITTTRPGLTERSLLITMFFVSVSVVIFCGIMVLIKKKNNRIFLLGIMLGVISSLLFLYIFFNIETIQYSSFC